MNKTFKDQMESYVDSLIKSYHENPVSYKKTHNLPDRDVVVEIVNDLNELLFPQYFSDKRLDESNENYVIGNQIYQVYHKLVGQLKLAYLYENEKVMISDDEMIICNEDTADMCSETACAERTASYWAETVCNKFFEELPEIHKILMMDIQAAFDGDPAAESKDQIVFSYPGLRAISIHRVAHVFYKLNVPIIPRIMSEYAHSKTGIDIHPGAEIGKYFFIDHGTGVVIGETTEIGDRVKIYQGVTLGALSTRNADLLRKTKRHPTIKDNVTIYSGATVLGGNTVIGENSIIGGSAFITQSVPANKMVSVRREELNIDEAMAK